MAVTPEVGQVEALEREAFGTPPESARRLLDLQDELFSDEVVETVANGYLHARFLDQTELRIGSGSTVKLDKFVFDPASQSGELVINLGQGVFRFITGDLNPESIKIVTPVATMGIRGTDLIIQVLPLGGIIVLLLSGEAFIQPLFGDGGLVVLTPGSSVAVGLDGSIDENAPIPPFEALYGLVSDLAELFPQPEAGPDGAAVLVPPGSSEAFNAFIIEFFGAEAAGPVQFVSLEDPVVVEALQLVVDLLAGIAAETTQENLLTALEAIAPGPVTVVVVEPLVEPPIEGLPEGEPEGGGGEPVISTVILGTAGDDVLTGTEFADSLFGFSGNDLLFGAGSGDSLFGGVGSNDTLYGDTGDDVLYGDEGDGAAFGDSDTLYGGAGADTLFGDGGNDLLSGDAGDDRIYGGGGNDVAVYQGNSTGYSVVAIDGGFIVTDLLPGVSGDDGTDTLFGVESIQFLNGLATTLFTPGADIQDLDSPTAIPLPGTQFDALGGNDTVILPDANGGLAAWDNTQTFFGGAGDDTVTGGLLDDTMAGDSGADTLYGNGGNDALFGGADGDTLYGGIGSADTLLGDAGNDVLYGDEGLYGGNDDSLFGGDGDDTLYGEGGNDSLTGGIGNDVIYGGTGSDIGLYLGASDGYDVVDDNGVLVVTDTDTTDGDDGTDTLFGVEALEFSDGVAAPLFTGGNDVEDLNAPSTIPLPGTQFDALGGNDTVTLPDANDGPADWDNTQTFFGGAGDDSITGGALDDRVAGESGNDTLGGEGGNDSLTGGGGNDILYGGLGTDAALYLGASEGYSVTNENGVLVVTDTDPTDGDDGTDTLFGVETLEFSDGTAAPLFTGGNDVENLNSPSTIPLPGTQFDALGGNDTVILPDANDGPSDWDNTQTFFGGAGDDSVTGGALDDRVAGEAGNDTLAGGAAADLLYGGEGDDQLYGDGPDSGLAGDGDTLFGGVGNDLLFGGGGADSLFGGLGSADSLFGGADGDLIVGDTGGGKGAGNDDLLYGGGGADTLFGDGGADTVYGGDGNDQVNGDFGNDVLYGDAGADSVFGSAGNDAAYGGGGTDLIYGSSGNDTLFGDGEADTLVGGSGDDTLYGGSGTDRAIFQGTANDYTVTAIAGGFLVVDNDSLYGGDNGTNTLFGVEEIVFSDDTLTGLFTAGADTVDLEPDGDLPGFLPGSQYDALGGDDEVTLPSRNGGGADWDDTQTFFGGAGNDTITARSLDDLVDGGSGNDSLYGDFGFDRLEGGDGDDILDGGEDGDTLFGSAGNDLLLGQEGGDSLFGGLGSIDTLYGGEADDALYGDTGIDPLTDTVGDDDRLFGGSDGDTLYGEGGADSLVGDEGAPAYGGADTLYGGTGNDTLSADGGNDTLFGGADDDVLDGGNETDTLYGGQGIDRLDGGNNGDIVYGGDGNDALVSGGVLSDTVYGDSGDDQVYGDGLGLPGDDTVYGDDGLAGTVDGADTLYGGVRSDTLYGDDGDDAATGGNDTLIGGGGTVDSLYGEGGDDALYGDDLLFDSGADLLFGGAGNDLLVGDDGSDGEGGDGVASDELFGGAGNDQLYGEADSDSLSGGADEDTLFGGSGGDQLYGDGGNDVFGFSAGDGSGGATLFMADVIADFADGFDRIGLIDLSFGTLPGEVSFLTDGAVVEGGGTGVAILVINGAAAPVAEVLAVIPDVPVEDLTVADVIELP